LIGQCIVCNDVAADKAESPTPFSTAPLTPEDARFFKQKSVEIDEIMALRESTRRKDFPLGAGKLPESADLPLPKDLVNGHFKVVILSNSYEADEKRMSTRFRVVETNNTEEAPIGTLVTYSRSLVEWWAVANFEQCAAAALGSKKLHTKTFESLLNDIMGGKQPLTDKVLICRTQPYPTKKSKKWVASPSWEIA
jgi:hypothetical protein